MSNAALYSYYVDTSHSRYTRRSTAVDAHNVSLLTPHTHGCQLLPFPILRPNSVLSSASPDICYSKLVVIELSEWCAPPVLVPCMVQIDLSSRCHGGYASSNSSPSCD